VLTRYWFEFDGAATDLPPGVALGCGVTAYDLDDAIALLREHVFDGEPPPITRVIENIDLSTLDEGHVLPNMEPHVWRGIWFPLGYR
jgi:hypothetical protein